MSFCPCWIKRLGILGLGLFLGLISQKRKGSAMERFTNLKVRRLGSCPCDAVYKMLVTLKKTHSAPLFPYLWNYGLAPSVLTALGGSARPHIKEISSALNYSTHRASESDFIRRRVSVANVKFENHWAGWLLGPLPALMFLKIKFRGGHSWSCGKVVWIWAWVSGHTSWIRRSLS